MALTKSDLLLYQGDDYAGTVLVSNADGTPADLTGYTAQSQIRRLVADADPVVVVEIGTTVVSPNVILSIPHLETETLQGRYVWDLQLTTPDDQIMTIIAGKVILTSEVTRV